MINAIKASLGVTLRDYATLSEISPELNNDDIEAINLADTLINTGLTPSRAPEWFKPYYKKLFDELGGDAWATSVLYSHRFIAKLLDSNKLAISDFINIFNAL